MIIATDDDTAALRAEIDDLRMRLADAEARLRQDGGGGSRAGAEGSRPPTEASSDSRYRRIVESAIDYAIVATDLDGGITDWNDAAEHVFGWSAGQMVGRSISTIFSADDIEAGIPSREMRFALTTGKAHDDRWHVRADGGSFFAGGQMMPLFGDDAQPIGYLKILRDLTRDEAHRRELAVSQRRLQFALDASALVGTWDWDVQNDIVFADSRFAGLFGVDPVQAADGGPLAIYLAGVHPDDRQRLRAAFETAVASGGTLAEKFRAIDASGDVRWVFARGRSFQDGHGRPERFPGAVVDITLERKREARQTALLQIGDDFLTASGVVDYTYKALETLGWTLGLDRVGYASVDPAETYATILDEWTRDDVEPLSGRYDLARFGSEFMGALRTGSAIVADTASDPITRPGGEAWAAIGVGSTVNMTIVENGRVRVILYLHDRRTRVWDEEDIGFIREVLNRSWTFNQRRRAEAALVGAETRLRLAQEAADIGTFDYDLQTGKIVWDVRCRAAFGIFDAREISYAKSFLAGLHPDDRDRTDAAVQVALDPSGNGDFDIVFRTIGREDAVLRWVHASGQTVVADGKTVRFVGAVRDVTEEKESEERQQLLTRELQHRVKNTLAMVNALANQTLRRAKNAQDGLAAFTSRLIALSHAHDILTQTSWTSAPIRAIVAQSLATHQIDGTRRIRWSGPDIRLTAKQGLALALALHELATNATKYGSLSNEDGCVDIAWRIAEAEVPRLLFEWRERDGPAVAPPTSRGFGSRLIEQSLALEFDGTVELQYPEAGVVCLIDAPIREDAGIMTIG